MPRQSRNQDIDHSLGALGPIRPRDLRKAKRALEQARSQAALANGRSIALLELDLADLRSVRAAADNLLLTAGHFALDPEGAKALWAKSEEMAGERFDVPADQVADVIAL